jgi:CubicO group peptidase (beta-lactamase class C family)
MKTAILLAFSLSALIAANLPSSKPEDVGMSSERLQRITQMMEKRVAAGDFVGAAAIVARKGKIVYQAGVGVMDLARGVDDQAGDQRRDHDDDRRGQGPPQ